MSRPPSIAAGTVREALRTLTASSQRITARALAQILGCSSRTAWRELQRFGVTPCPHCQGRGRIWQKGPR